MNTAIGIYDDHELAVAAVRKLKESDFPMDHLTIMGKAETEVVDNEMNITEKNPLKLAPLGAGTAVGTALGILAGVGVFAIPGLGFLYGAGALVGAFAGFDFGLIGGGIASALATIGVKDENEQKYHHALDAGKFLVIVHGSEEDVNNARAILRLHGTHNDIAHYPKAA